jgi:hypothetical protein
MQGASVMQEEIGVSLDMLLTNYETDTSQTGVCTGKIGSWYSFGKREKNIPLSNLFNGTAFFETSWMNLWYK